VKTFRITTTYKTQYHDPIQLEAGDQVKLGEEEQEEKWKGWIWGETDTQKGWIPMQIVNISADRTTGIITESYSAQELDVDAGDQIVPLKSLNGWTWALNQRTNRHGWIPDEIIAREQ
jgi:hypothetical protein